MVLPCWDKVDACNTCDGSAADMRFVSAWNLCVEKSCVLCRESVVFFTVAWRSGEVDYWFRRRHWLLLTSHQATNRPAPGRVYRLTQLLSRAGEMCWTSVMTTNSPRTRRVQEIAKSEPGVRSQWEADRKNPASAPCLSSGRPWRRRKVCSCRINTPAAALLIHVGRVSAWSVSRNVRPSLRLCSPVQSTAVDSIVSFGVYCRSLVCNSGFYCLW